MPSKPLLKLSKENAEAAAAICSSSIAAAVLHTDLDTRIRNSIMAAIASEDEVLSLFVTHLLDDLAKLLCNVTGKPNEYRSEIAAAMHRKASQLWMEAIQKTNKMVSGFDTPVALDDIPEDVLTDVHDSVKAAHDMEKVATFLDGDTRHRLRAVAGAIDQRKAMEHIKDNALAQKLALVKPMEDEDSNGGPNGFH